MKTRSNVKNPEAGAASIFIDLRNSTITVTHGDTADLLLKRKVSDGFWCKQLWPLLRGEIDASHLNKVAPATANQLNPK